VNLVELGISLSDLKTSLDTGQQAGAAQRVADTIDYAYRRLGIDRFFGQFDRGGLPRQLVEEFLLRLATEIAPAVRANNCSLAQPA